MSSSPSAAYFLRTARLGFGVWSAKDLPLARELWGDPEVTRFFGGPFPDEEVARRLDLEIARRETCGYQYWPLYSLRDGDHVGCCGLRPYRPAEKIHELGFHLRPRYWGQGLAREAASAVIAFAFHSAGAAALSAGHHPENAASKKVLETLGFAYTHHEFFPGLGIEIPYYALDRIPHPGS
jgi:ribosomal-protein-alanine N-acetyltransferase